MVAGKSLTRGALVAFDNIKLLKCFPEGDRVDLCTPNEYRCSTTNVCINNSKICDITRDCANGDDEAQNCGKLTEAVIVYYPKTIFNFYFQIKSLMVLDALLNMIGVAGKTNRVKLCNGLFSMDRRGII